MNNIFKKEPKSKFLQFPVAGQAINNEYDNDSIPSTQWR